MPLTKRCDICDQEKVLPRFEDSNESADGYSKTCKQCQKQERKEDNVKKNAYDWHMRMYKNIYDEYQAGIRIYNSWYRRYVYSNICYILDSTNYSNEVNLSRTLKEVAYQMIFGP